MVYRILSLDGGGIRGFLTVSILIQLEEKGAKFIDSCDLFAGTSTGALIATSLAAGHSLPECLEFYEKHWAEVFKRSFWREVEGLGSMFGAKYTNEGLKAILSQTFGSLTLGQLKKHVLISTLEVCPDSGAWRPRFYYSGNPSDRDVSVVDVLLSATAAPTYFPIHNGRVDAGLVVNNPSMCALTCALDQTNQSQSQPPVTPPLRLDAIRLLSVSTGKNIHSLEPQYKDADWGWGQWIYKERIINLISDSSVSVTHVQAMQLLGLNNYHRIDPVLPQPVLLDDGGSLDVLRTAAQNLDLSDSLRWVKECFVGEQQQYHHQQQQQQRLERKNGWMNAGLGMVGRTPTPTSPSNFSLGAPPSRLRVETWNDLLSSPSPLPHRAFPARTSLSSTTATAAENQSQEKSKTDNDDDDWVLL